MRCSAASTIQDLWGSVDPVTWCLLVFLAHCIIALVTKDCCQAAGSQLSGVCGGLLGPVVVRDIVSSLHWLPKIVATWLSETWCLLGSVWRIALVTKDCCHSYLVFVGVCWAQWLSETWCLLGSLRPIALVCQAAGWFTAIWCLWGSVGPVTWCLLVFFWLIALVTKDCCQAAGSQLFGVCGGLLGPVVVRDMVLVGVSSAHCIGHQGLLPSGCQRHGACWGLFGALRWLPKIVATVIWCLWGSVGPSGCQRHGACWGVFGPLHWLPKIVAKWLARYCLDCLQSNCTSI